MINAIEKKSTREEGRSSEMLGVDGKWRHYNIK